MSGVTLKIHRFSGSHRPGFKDAVRLDRADAGRGQDVRAGQEHLSVERLVSLNPRRKIPGHERLAVQFGVQQMLF